MLPEPSVRKVVTFAVSYPSANCAPLVSVTESLRYGLVVPMPTLPSIINPPVGAAVVSYPLPKLPPPDTLNIDPGAVSPMPTLPPEKIAAGPGEFCCTAKAGLPGGGGGGGRGP